MEGPTTEKGWPETERRVQQQRRVRQKLKRGPNNGGGWDRNSKEGPTAEEGGTETERRVSQRSRVELKLKGGSNNGGGWD